MDYISFFKLYFLVFVRMGFPGSSDGKASAYNVGDPGSIPGSGRSPREGNGNPLQYSCLENPMDGGAWGGYSPWGRKESDKTEWLHFHFVGWELLFLFYRGGNWGWESPLDGFSQSWWVAELELEPGSLSCHNPSLLIVKYFRSNDMPCLFLLSANWIPGTALT